MAPKASAETTRTEAETCDERADALETEAERVRDADSLADTPWSALFHVSRTTKTDLNGGYSSVEVQYRATVNGVETHSEPVKTRQGEHLRGTDAWDGTIKLRVEPFKTTSHAAERIAGQLEREARHLRQRAERARREAERMEGGDR